MRNLLCVLLTGSCFNGYGDGGQNASNGSQYELVTLVVALLLSYKTYSGRAWERIPFVLLILGMRHCVVLIPRRGVDMWVCMKQMRSPSLQSAPDVLALAALTCIGTGSVMYSAVIMAAQREVPHYLIVVNSFDATTRSEHFY